jgi:hypothetical protein
MPRVRFLDYRYSRAPKVLGFCVDDTKNLAMYANSAERRLVLAREAGEEGWYGTWAEVAFNNVSRTNPYITCPRSIARLEAISVCQKAVPIRNQFFEYLQFSNGRLPKECHGENWSSCNNQVMTRNNAITFAEPTIKPFYVRIYATNPDDAAAAKRVLIQGLDQNDQVVYTQDALNQVTGEFITANTPFATSTFLYNRLTGIQKDQTSGDISFFQVDPATGDETQLLVMEPSETVAGYRRYYLDQLPSGCCNVVAGSQAVTITAIAKMEMIPVLVDTDYLLLQNIEALIEESISLRMSEMDSITAQQLAGIHHANATRLLNSEVHHYLGINEPAVNFAPFGSAKLERLNVTMF